MGCKMTPESTEAVDQKKKDRELHASRKIDAKNWLPSWIGITSSLLIKGVFLPSPAPHYATVAIMVASFILSCGIAKKVLNGESKGVPLRSAGLLFMACILMLEPYGTEPFMEGGAHRVWFIIFGCLAFGRVIDLICRLTEKEPA